MTGRWQLNAVPICLFLFLFLVGSYWSLTFLFFFLSKSVAIGHLQTMTKRGTFTTGLHVCPMSCKCVIGARICQLTQRTAHLYCACDVALSVPLSRLGRKDFGSIIKNIINIQNYNSNNFKFNSFIIHKYPTYLKLDKYYFQPR